MIRLLRTSDGRLWVAIGAAVGLAMTHKWLVPLLVLALGLSLLAVGPRAVLRTWWLPAGVAVALWFRRRSWPGRPRTTFRC